MASQKVQVRNVLGEKPSAAERATTRAAAAKAGVPDGHSKVRNQSARADRGDYGASRANGGGYAQHGETPQPKGRQNAETMGSRGR